MPEYQTGQEVEYVVTFLEMAARPGYPRPHAPVDAPLALFHAEEPPPWYFLTLYDAVGGAYEWTDWHHRPVEELASFIGDRAVELFTLYRKGWPAGFFMLDCRSAGICNLAYFGIVPEAAGRGLGTWLLQTAVHMAWDRPEVVRLTVNTNTLDHPAALNLYQKVGFEPVRRETHRRQLTRPRLIP
ncbi:MAG TPA: GNAT family N-acetyltransferase [Paracoccaceae bacterium]|nr:GNAT family N-acetyltransferase [Paracoccaceae bacterium]